MIYFRLVFFWEFVLFNCSIVPKYVFILSNRNCRNVVCAQNGESSAGLWGRVRTINYSIRRNNADMCDTAV